MALKVYKPTTNGRRDMTSQDFSDITTKKPLKSLLKINKSRAGRNNQGRITTRHQGGGVKKFYRLMNHNLAAGTEAVVEHIEYDPNRSARIARIKDQHGLYHYVLASKGMTTGSKVQSGEQAPVELNNRLPLSKIPTGTQIYGIEFQAGKGAQVVRSAGTKAQLMAKEGVHALIRMPSGEVRKFRLECMASVGVVGNEQHQNVKLGSAGRRRHMGVRPGVRGVVMNAVDHPHGGGDGGRHGTGKAPRTPWGQLTLGYRTRTRKSTSKMIVKSRHAAKRKRG
jgi:large subunit ribosomal protein L2